MRLKSVIQCLIILISIERVYSYCLQPEIPENGHVIFPQSGPHPTGTRAKYSCDLGFIHLGVEERVCMSDGTWSHPAPVCAVNVALHKPAFQSTVVTTNGGKTLLHANLSTDGVLEGFCSSTLTEAKPWWRVDLLEEYRIYAVEVLLGDAIGLPWLEISIVSATTEGKTDRTLCTERRGNLEANQLHTFICDEEINGRYVTVTSTQGALNICEAFVLAKYSPSPWQCENSVRKEVLGIHGGYCYARSIQQKLPWFDAQNDCLKHGASLPLHLDFEQHTYLSSQLLNRINNDAQFYWLGLMATKNGDQSTWKWVDGVKLNESSTNWADPTAQTVPTSRESTPFSVGMAKAFNWKWMPISQTIWNSWICQSKPRFCASPGVSSAGGVMISSQTYSIGTTAFYYCTHGFRLDGLENRRCQENGVWSNTPPTCKIVTCPLPSPLSLGEVRLLNGTTTYGSLVEYRCQGGYNLNSQQKFRICQADGTWSGEVPNCIELHCKTPRKIDNGTVIVNGTRYGSIAKYHCLPGHRMVGQSRLSCSENGRWKPEAPTCYDLASFRLLIESQTDSSNVPELRTQMNWLIVFVVAVFVFLVLIFTALLLLWRRRKQPDLFSLSNFFGTQTRSDLACSRVSVVGDKNNLLYGFSGIGTSTPASTPSSGSTPPNCPPYYAPYFHASTMEMESSNAIYVTSKTAQQRFEQNVCDRASEVLHYATATVIDQPNGCDVTELELPPHLLKLEQLPNGNLHLTLPCRPRLSRPPIPIMATAPPSVPPLVERTGSLPRLPEKVRTKKKFQRPKKFQTMVSNVRKKLSEAANPNVAPETTQRRLSAADIVLVGLQKGVSDPELRKCNDSPTPSELLYSFNDDELSELSDESEEQPPSSLTTESRVYFEFDIEASKDSSYREPIYDFPPGAHRNTDEQKKNEKEDSESIDSNVYEELKSDVCASAIEHSGFELVHTIC